MVQNAEEQDTQIKSKEPTINKKTGFNLDKTDLTENDSNKLFTAKGALNLFDTLTTNITNAINAAKEALGIDIAKKLDKGIYTGDAQSLKTSIDSKEPAITKKTGFNLDKTDSTENDSNKLFTAKGALNLFDILTTNITNAINAAKEVLGIDIAKKLDKGIYTGDAQSLKTSIDSKEPVITKKTGFNLDKTDSIENDSNRLFTAKGALNLFNTLTTSITEAINSAKEVLGIDIAKKLDKGTYTGNAQDLKTSIDSKEPVITKKTGFNLDKTDSTENDSNKLFTAKGALNLTTAINEKETAFSKNTAFNKAFGTNTNEVLEGDKLAEILGIEYGGVLNNTNAKVVGKGYYDTVNKKIYKCTANTSINYADAGYFIEISNNDLLGKLQNLNKSYLIESGNYYRKYSDGYLEQWGTTTATDGNNIKVEFIKAFKDTNYTLLFNGVISSNPEAADGLGRVKSKTITNATVASGSIAVKTITWRACGY